MTTIIKVDNLSIANERQAIINQLSFEIQQGEFVSITGQSGSGKSTVLKFLAQLNDPTLKVSGSYHLLGKDVNDYSPIELRQIVSYFYQTPSLFGDTVRDNLAFPYEIRHEEFDEQRAIEMLNNVDLSHSFLDKNIKSLSGGERQRVALIRNLMYPSKVLLLDEISSALDFNTRQIIWSWLEKYRQEQDATILMVSHLDEEHEMTDRKIEIVKLAEGSDVNE
ncbi:ABC transporter ATP-binding protein [Globicatella sanguinis]|uniref:ABC transporter ATP-binding protein n=1 Tax=Globicatella sanguinis TaxID=13076 RepID=UPI0025429129|nr:ATP-binding cassette domain-containing protein [Globicatella sanguinis]MDK7630993.1 ATP-binding cassette domain-containing protein [Globicatella sanguinis]WIK66271.1 ATP-binding cassette domain-containing protein [Globicatella sanguinis]WKT55676.1 ATP-binding cassette domain-containing protein [Globicatella sanguinis]